MTMNDTLPPHNEVAEWALVACGLEKPALLPGILPEAFYCESPRRVLARAQQLHAEAVPERDLQIALQMELHRTAPELFTRTMQALNDLPSPENWTVYRDEIDALAEQRAAVSLASEVGELAASGRLDPATLAERVKTLARPRAETFNVADAVRDAVDRIEASYTNPDADYGVRSGLSGIDRITRGWRPGELVIVGARPSVGKTTFAMNCTAEAVLRGKVPVVFYSLEMPTSQLMRSLLLAESRIDRDSFRQQRLVQGDFDRLARATALLKGCRLTVRDNVRDVEAVAADLARQFQSTTKPGLVVVDYLQILGTRAAAAEKRYAQVGAVSRALKLFAMQFRLPVLALAQLTRELDRTEREPVLADLRESGSLEQDADMVLFLHPTGGRVAYKPTPTRCIVAKNRNGPLGSVMLAFHQAQGRFYEAVPDHA